MALHRHEDKAKKRISKEIRREKSKGTKQSKAVAIALSKERRRKKGPSFE